MSGTPQPRGRTRIAARALERIAGAVAADALGGDRRRTSVALADHEGSLDIAIDAAVRTVSLARAAEEPGAVDRSGGPLLGRAEAAGSTVRDRVHELTGRSVQRVSVHITGVQVQQERRVR